jgi:arsenate reductase (thioredoxin)
MTTPSTILFVCEHGAAKSIIAAAYFNKLAYEMGLNLQAIARGTLPDDQLSPVTIQGLAQDGLISTELTPRKLLPSEITSAQHVIAFGDLLNKEDYQDVDIENWNQVPPVSSDYQIARDAIVEQLHQLLVKMNDR